MAVATATQYGINPAGGGLQSVGGLRATQSAVTMDGTNYATGGVVVTPQQLGLSHVYLGVCTVRTPNATNGPGDAVLDCTNPDAPKIKCNAPSGLAETGAVTLVGAVLDVVALGV